MDTKNVIKNIHEVLQEVETHEKNYLIEKKKSLNNVTDVSPVVKDIYKDAIKPEDFDYEVV
jgi:hypothetical protein